MSTYSEENSAFDSSSEISVFEDDNGAFYHRGPNAESVAEYNYKIRDDSVRPRELFYYSGEDYLTGPPTRNEIVAENDDGLTAVLKQALAKQEDIPFMPVDIEESNEYINNIPHYVLRLYGSLINGQKAVITITGIKVFFDIRIPDDKTIDVFKTEIKDTFRNGKDDEGETVDTSKIRIEHVKAFPICGYHAEKKSYLRIYTTTTFQRKVALNIIIKYNLEIENSDVDKHKLETASDDKRAYYRKVAREYRISLSGWALINNYEYNNSRLPYKGRSHLCSHAFYTSINNFNTVEDPSKLYKTYPSSAILHDRTLVLTWDIETYTTRGLEHVPKAKYKEDSIFMICMTLHWKDDPKPLKQICLVDVEIAPDPNWITIVCGNQTNLLKAFALCWRGLAPDIELTYNGSQYDWPFIVEKASQLQILDWMFTQMTGNPRQNTSIDGILRWNYYGGVGNPSDKDFFREDQSWTRNFGKKKDTDNNKKIKNRECVEIKISSEKEFKSSFLKVPGCVPIDVIVCYKKLHPRSEKNSLDYYLKKYDLGSKIDMPIKDMRIYYEKSKKITTTATSKNIHKIAKYCIVDSISCQKLMIRRNVLNDYREVASIAYVSLFDSHYYAGGMKVRNLLGAEAWKRDILITMIASKQTESGNFPGAYVFPPEKGLENKRPVTGLDFASLYPSIIMNYNLSPDKMISTSEEADTLKKEKLLHKIEFPFNNRTLRAWTIRHENKSNQKGLYPVVLENLLNKRNQMKSQLELLGKRKEYMELVISKTKEKNLSIMDAINHVLKNIEDKKERASTLEYFNPEGSYADFVSEYNSICFDHSCLDSKQKAVKLYMNTFYGEMGNTLSPFFKRELAGGVTSTGQHNIKLVAEFVNRKGFKTKYGDTDSLYLTCPDKFYKKCDFDYNNGKGTISKLEYWTEMVKITMNVMKKLRDDVNSYLRLKTRSTYLKMAYEEVLFPVCFTGKKKYFGIPHIENPNFKPKKLFIKGIDSVKQGQSEIFKIIGEKIMRKAMEVDNEVSVHKIVEDVIREAISDPKQWKYEQFIKTYTWKPNVQNQPVQRFMKRMNKLYKNKIPDPGERFNYVVTKADADFDLSGKRLHPTKGDLMEFVDVVKELEKELDYLYYFRDDIVGLCARFIMYDDRYQPSSSDKIMELEDPDEKYKKIDNYSQDKAKKWLGEYVNGLNGVTPKMITSRGPAYKRAYQNAIKKARDILYQEIGDSYEIFHGNWLSFEYFKVDDPVEVLWEKFIEYAKSSTQNSETRSAKNISVNDKIKESICSGFVKHLDTLIKIVEKYDEFFHKLVYHMRYKEHVSNPQKIGAPKTMRKNEMIAEQPTLPHIPKTDQLALDNFLNTWNMAVSSI